ncbi:flagellar motor switch protein FliM [Pacificibacter maritimus]|uniref:Flagellar motor switch protein FliM n=1 Tax=Pacificibacter maritimus TaxID=762213 RepID=A0A3N4UP64_9RHOB|nr:FliM/FliN family flagellar motor switch protein [Pacificibacter maritimus]RPE71818.1 flagellar motor switch protein FliM [Pacificibacter maritimus]
MSRRDVFCQWPACLGVKEHERILMADEDLISAMRRKAGVGRPPPDVTAMSAPKALRLALAKAAEDCTGMVLQVGEVIEEITSVSRLPDSIDDHSLLALLEGPDSAYGLAVFSLGVTTSVVEQLTTGKVQKYSPEKRDPTSTDSVMCFDVIDRMLANFETIVAEASQPPEIANYRTAAQLSETRSIPIAFDDIRYRMYRVSVDMGRGVRQGEIMFVFPASRPKPKVEAGMQTAWETSFQASVLKTEAQLSSVLHRVSLSLSDVANLQVGMQIPVPKEALNRVELVADGRRISIGRLGQVNGHRAVRINLNPVQENDADMSMTNDFSSGEMMDMNGTDGEMPDLGDLPDIGADFGGGFETPNSMGRLGDLPDPDLAMGVPSLSDIGSDFGGGFGGDLPPLTGDDGLPDSGDFPAMGDLPALG